MVLKRFKSYCEKYGFTTDKDLLELNNIFKHNHFTKLHIDIYTENPYMLLSRMAENNVDSVIENDRIIIRKGDRNKTSIVNILKDNIDCCIVKRYDNTRYEIIVSMCGIYYKIFAIL